MPLQPTYPGVYVQELPGGTHTISSVATSVSAFVGYLARGPMDAPVQCLDFGDFQRVFGRPDPDSLTSLQVSQFFLNGGTEAWVSRVCAGSAPPVQPRVELRGAVPVSATDMGEGADKGLAPTPGTTLVQIASHNPGSWGENIFVTVDYMTNKPDTFNMTATLYSESKSGNSASHGYHIVEAQHVSAVTLDVRKPESIIAVMQSGNQNDALLAVPLLTASPPVSAPFASGTMLEFIPPESAVSATFTVIVQPPGSDPAMPPPPLQSTLDVAVSVSTQADLVAAIQSAIANAARDLRLFALGDAQVRSCLSPFISPTGTQTPLVQIWVPDPDFADYLVSIRSTPALFTVQSINHQAQRLAAPATANPVEHPDGLPPTGPDIAGDATARTGIHALDAMRIVNIIAVPDMESMGTADYLAAATATLDYAVRRKAFAILDMPSRLTTPSDAAAWATQTLGTVGAGVINGASYWPQVQISSPCSARPLSLGASGTMAGIYAAADVNRGVWKAPAGITAVLTGVERLAYVMTDQENGQLNPLGINALRSFPVYGSVAWGARTLASANLADDDCKYVPVRRLALYLEQSLIQGLQWVVFEPNDARLWAQIRLSVNAFLHPLYLQGAFVGATPAQAYLVICDESTTTAEDMINGIVNIAILFAPMKPAEFVVINLQQMAGQSSS
ncbi:phage tail sheath family protein [Sphingomonas suaedae]|uniref:Phage tail sheath family protein n=1 Tax=Sphingomonas suaedae TaxID=2599297 RepID=A0A518RGH8_9SPHN|nr:phage tail sheath subtilisin-like domain-containing protein [Sphingomonas suaedae]QDX26519.1 phage tail sheath family protein [Sphingomonas suaedae]